MQSADRSCRQDHLSGKLIHVAHSQAGRPLCARFDCHLFACQGEPASGGAVISGSRRSWQLLHAAAAAAVLAGPVHAQVCSGGNDGGVDATGNQCNTPNDVAAYTIGSGITSPARAVKMGSVKGIGRGSASLGSLDEDVGPTIDADRRRGTGKPDGKGGGAVPCASDEPRLRSGRLRHALAARMAEWMPPAISARKHRRLWQSASLPSASGARQTTA